MKQPFSTVTLTDEPMSKNIVKLQNPKWIFFRGAIRPSEEAVFHVYSEAVVRGLNVFEGLKGFWQPDGSFGIVALRRHWERLKRSAKLLHIPFDMSFEAFEEACHGLTQRLYEPDKNMWIRATLYVTDGHWGVGTKADLVLTAYHHPAGPAEPMSTGVSTWQRASDVALPCRIKTSTNYQVARLAKIEGRERGYPEMVLLNQHGRVAEAIGSAIIVVREGVVITPPSWEGAFESITVNIIDSLCETLGIPFIRRPIDRTELIIADEIAFVGTLNDLVMINAIDEHKLREPDIVSKLLDRYLEAATGKQPHPAVDLSCRPPNDVASPYPSG